MAEIWVAGATLAVGVYSANQAKKGAQAGVDANNAAMAEDRRQFDINQANQQPWIDFGKQNIDAMGRFLAGDDSGFKNSADYQFRFSQGMKGLENSAAARGGFSGGRADADTLAYAQGLAGQAADNYYAKLSSGAGQGYGAVQNMGQAGQNLANNIGGYLQNSAQQRQSSYGANSDLAAGAAGLFSNWYNNNKANNPGGTGWYLGNNPGKG